MDNGLEPAPERGVVFASSPARSLRGVIAATDFFSVEVLTLKGLVRYFVLFVIDLKTRRVVIAGISSRPDGAWMQQVARNLADAHDGFLRNARYLIHDRDPLFTGAFKAILKSGGVKTVKLPVRSPNLNGHAERFVLSIKSECVSKIIPLGERHLRLAVGEYAKHYHLERNHQGLGNRLIERSRGHPSEFGRVACRERLGGVLKYYYREAA